MGKGLKFVGLSEYDDKYQCKDENRINYSDVVATLKDRNSKGSNTVYLTEDNSNQGRSSSSHSNQGRSSSSHNQQQQQQIMGYQRQDQQQRTHKSQMHFSTETSDKFKWPSEQQQRKEQQMKPLKTPEMELNKSRVMIGSHHPIVTKFTSAKEKTNKTNSKLTGSSISTRTAGRSVGHYFAPSSTTTSELQSESPSKKSISRSSSSNSSNLIGDKSSRSSSSQRPLHHLIVFSNEDVNSTSDATTLNRNIIEDTALPFRQPSSSSYPSNNFLNTTTTAMTTDSLAAVAHSAEFIDDSTTTNTMISHLKPTAADAMNTSSYSLTGELNSMQ